MVFDEIQNVLNSPVPLVSGKWNNISFDVPILVDINQPVTLTLKCIYFFEIICIIGAIFFMSYFTHFINSSSVFHKNLQYILIIEVVFFMFGEIARFYLLLVQLKFIEDLDSPLLLISGIFRLENFGMSLCGIPAIAIERSFATFYVHDYEAKSRFWIAVFSSSCAFIHTQLFVIPITFYKMPVFLIAIYASFGIIVSLSVIIYLYFSNHRKLKNINGRVEYSIKVTYTLSKKFQLEENIKIITYLRTMGIMIFILISIVLAVILIPCVILGTSNVSGQFIISLFDLILALASLIIPGLCIMFLRKTRPLPLFKNLKWFKHSGSLVIKPKISQVPNETKVYFDQLTRSWQ